jgi:hypothetical protein
LNLFLAVALLFLYISLMAIGITFIGLSLLSTKKAVDYIMSHHTTLRIE